MFERLFQKKEKRTNHQLRDIIDCLKDVSDLSLSYHAAIAKKQQNLEKLYLDERNKARCAEALVHASEILLNNQHCFDIQVKRVLKIIVDITVSDRSWVFKKRQDNIDLIAEAKHPSLPEMHTKLYSVLNFPELYAELETGVPVFLKKGDLPKEQQALLNSNMQALCVIPIFTSLQKEKIWGVLGMSLYKENVDWSDSEKVLLGSFCNIITGCLEVHGVIDD